IKYHDSTYKYATVNKASECKVWRGQICYTLTDLRSPKIYINVWAKNINVSQNGTESHPLSTETKEEDILKEMENEQVELQTCRNNLLKKLELLKG
ncbi:hypothetical protein Trydic_g12052, partial [Trypoxylus dichotomus]